MLRGRGRRDGLQDLDGEIIIDVEHPLRMSETQDAMTVARERERQADEERDTKS